MTRRCNRANATKMRADEGPAGTSRLLPRLPLDRPVKTGSIFPHVPPQEEASTTSPSSAEKEKAVPVRKGQRRDLASDQVDVVLCHLVPNNRRPRAVAILLGWMGAERAQLDAYAALYHDRHVCTVTAAAPSAALLSRDVESVRALVVTVCREAAMLVRRGEMSEMGHGPVPIVLHVFSNGGAVVLAEMERVLRDVVGADVYCDCDCDCGHGRVVGRGRAEEGSSSPSPSSSPSSPPMATKPMPMAAAAGSMRGFNTSQRNLMAGIQDDEMDNDDDDDDDENDRESDERATREAETDANRKPDDARMRQKFVVNALASTDDAVECTAVSRTQRPRPTMATRRRRLAPGVVSAAGSRVSAACRQVLEESASALPFSFFPFHRRVDMERLGDEVLALPDDDGSTIATDFSSLLYQGSASGSFRTAANTDIFDEGGIEESEPRMDDECDSPSSQKPPVANPGQPDAALTARQSRVASLFPPPLPSSFNKLSRKVLRCAGSAKGMMWPRSGKIRPKVKRIDHERTALLGGEAILPSYNTDERAYNLDMALVSSRLRIGFVLYDSAPCKERIAARKCSTMVEELSGNGAVANPMLRRTLHTIVMTSMACQQCLLAVVSCLCCRIRRRWRRDDEEKEEVGRPSFERNRTCLCRTQGNSDDFWHLMKEFSLTDREAYVYSSADVLMDFAKLEKFIDLRRNENKIDGEIGTSGCACKVRRMADRSVTELRFDDTTHVSHLSKHREEYEALIDEQLRAILPTVDPEEGAWSDEDEEGRK